MLYVQDFLRRLHLRRFQNQHKVSSKTDVKDHFYFSDGINYMIDVLILIMFDLLNTCMIGSTTVFETFFFVNAI